MAQAKTSNGKKKNPEKSSLPLTQKTMTKKAEIIWGYHAVEASLERVQEESKVIAEAMEEICNKKDAMADSLKMAGYETVTKVAQASPEGLAKATGLSMSIAEKLVLAAREVDAS